MDTIIPSDYKTLDTLVISFIGKDIYDLESEEGGVPGVIDSLGEVIENFFSDKQKKYEVKSYQENTEKNTFSNLIFSRVDNNYIGSEGFVVEMSSMGGLLVEIMMKDESGKEHVFEIDLERSSILIERSKSFVITTGLELQGEKLEQIVITAQS